MLQELQIVASELVKIQVADIGVFSYSFPQSLSRIEKGKIVAIQAYKNSDIAKTPEGETVVADAVFNATFLTLKSKENDTNDIKQTPLQDLRKAANSGVLERLKPLKVDFSQSKVEIPSGTVLVAGTFFLFRVYYIPDGC